MKLSRLSIPYRALKDIGTLVFIVLFSGNLSFRTMDLRFFILASVVFIFIVFLSVLWEYIVWRRYDYFFGEDSLRITHGVFRRDDREIPYRRIQNVDIKRNIVQRVLGIAKADFETAGGSGTEASLKYVELEEARDIQEKIRSFKREIEKEDGEDDGSERELVFELSGSDLVAYSFLSINGKSVIGALTVIGLSLGGLGSILGQVPFAPVLVISVLGILSLIGFWVFNAASNFMQYYDFKLWREKDTLEYERGLLNRSEGSIPVEKVQGVSIQENFLKRQLDYATMKIETAGLSNQQEIKSNVMAVPLAKFDTVIDFAQDLEDFNDFNLNSIPSRSRRRYFGRYSIGIGLLLLIGFGVDRFVTEFGYLFVISLLPVAVVAAHLKWVNRGFEVQDDYFISMNGFWNRRTSVTPYYRVQTLIQTETILQKRWDLSTLTLDTAGNIILSDSKATDIDVDEAVELREEVYDSFEKALKDSRES